MEEAPAIPWEEEDYQTSKIQAENRRNFITKVLGIVSIQMLITTAVTIATVCWDDSSDWFEDHWWVLFAFLAMIFIPEIALLCCMDSFARRVPINYILLLIFTLGFSGVTAVICSAYEPMSVILVSGLTAVITLILTVFALYTTTDFTKSIWVVSMYSCALSVVGLLFMFAGAPEGVTILVSCLWVIIYGIFLVIDVQLIADGRKYKFSEDDYIIAALQLYMDIMELFLKLLEILGKKKK